MTETEGAAGDHGRALIRTGSRATEATASDEAAADEAMARVVHLRQARGAVLVTGTSSGIGLATATTLARRGFHVIATVLSPQEAAPLLAYAPHGSVSVSVLDITDSEQREATVEQARALLRDAGRPGLAGLVNNAGIGVSGPTEALPVDRIRWQFEVNVFSQLALTQQLLPLLRSGGGRIVNIGSVGAWITMPFGGPLCASKAAFRAFNDALRLELKPSGVPVVLIEPGRVKTAAPDRVREELEPTIAHMSEESRARYAAGFRSMVTAMLRQENENGSSADPVARAVVKALTAARPRSRRPVGRVAHLLGFLGRMLPNPLLDRLRYRVLDLKEFSRGSS